MATRMQYLVQLGSGRKQTLWRTLTSGLTSEGFPAPERYADYFQRYIDFMEITSDKLSRVHRRVERSTESIRGDDLMKLFHTFKLIALSKRLYISGLQGDGFVG